MSSQLSGQGGEGAILLPGTTQRPREYDERRFSSPLLPRFLRVFALCAYARFGQRLGRVDLRGSSA